MQSKLKTLIYRGVGIAVLAAGALGFMWSQNNVINVKSYTYENNLIPKNFVGYDIVQVSDLHNMDTSKVLQKIQKQNPDLVIFTGNLSDDSGNYSNSVNLINTLASSTSVMYMLGDHDEANSQSILSSISDSAVYMSGSAYDLSTDGLSYDDYVAQYVSESYTTKANNGSEEAQAYLDAIKADIEADAGSNLVICGLENADDVYDYVYNIINLDKNQFQIAVTPNTNQIDVLSGTSIDMILCGGTFGVGTNGYTSGLYSVSGTEVSVSGGLGECDNIGSRFLNYPQIVSITLSDGTLEENNPLENLLSKFF